MSGPPRGHALPPLVPAVITSVRPYELFKPLQVRDAVLRASALERLLSQLRKLSRDGRGNLAAVLPTILRLSVEWLVA
jgi:hypothetical protein